MGRTGGPIKQTLLSGGVQNPPSKQLTNFEILKIKTRGVMTQRETLTWRFHGIKYKFFPLLRGKGGSDQTDTTLREGAESHRETFDQLWKPYVRNLVSYRVSRKKYTSFFHFFGGRGGPIKLTLMTGGYRILQESFGPILRKISLKLNKLWDLRFLRK